MRSWRKKREGLDLEVELRANRPEPSRELLHRLEARVREDGRRSRSGSFRVAFAGALAAGVLGALASVGVQFRLAIPGLPGVGANVAPEGRPRLATETICGAELEAASWTVKGCPAVTVKSAPSAGVGACQMSPSCGPRTAPAPAASARAASAANTPLLVIQLFRMTLIVYAATGRPGTAPSG